MNYDKPEGIYVGQTEERPKQNLRYVDSLGGGIGTSCVERGWRKTGLQWAAQGIPDLAGGGIAKHL